MRKRYLLVLVLSAALLLVYVCWAGDGEPRPRREESVEAPSVSLYQRAERIRELQRIMRGQTPVKPPAVAAPTPLPPATKPEKIPTVRVLGIVVDEQGTPQSDIYVRLRDLQGGKVGKRATTDVKGCFILPRAPVGTHLVVAESWGDRLGVTRVDLRADHKHKVRIVVGERAAARLRGQVVGPSGEPVYGVTVAAEPRIAARTDLQRVMVARAAEHTSTNEKGMFEVTMAEGGWYRVRLQSSFSRGAPLARLDLFASPDPRPERIMIQVPVITCRLVGPAGRTLRYNSFGITGHDHKGMAIGIGGVSSGDIGETMSVAWADGQTSLSIELSGAVNRETIKGEITLKRPGPCVIRGR